MIPRMLLVRGILFPVTLIDILTVIFLRLPVCLLHGTHDLVHGFAIEGTIKEVFPSLMGPGSKDKKPKVRT